MLLANPPASGHIKRRRSVRVHRQQPSRPGR